MSLNLPAVEVLADVGAPNFLARLHSAGAEIALPKDTPIGLAIGLGGLGISLVDLARLYSGLARGGEAPALIERLDGAPPTIGPRRVTEPVAAFYVQDILRGAPPPANALSGRIAFKTGTSYGFRDALAIGFDRLTTIAVWVGRPDNGPTPGLDWAAVSAAPILFDAFARLGRDIETIRAPKGVLRVTTSAELPPPLRHLKKGRSQDDAGHRRQRVEDRLPPGRRAHRSRAERRRRSETEPESARRRPTAHLVHQRRTDRWPRPATANGLETRRRRVRASLGDGLPPRKQLSCRAARMTPPRDRSDRAHT